MTLPQTPFTAHQYFQVAETHRAKVSATLGGLTQGKAAQDSEQDPEASAGASRRHLGLAGWRDPYLGTHPGAIHRVSGP